MSSDGASSYSVADADAINVRKFFELIWAGRWTVGICLSVVLLAAIFYAVVALPVFTADGLVEVETDSKQGGISSQLNDISSLLSGTPVQTEAEIQILQSRMILQQVIDKMNLQVSAKPKYFPVIGEAIARFNSRRASGELISVPSWLRGFCWGGENIYVSSFDVPEGLFDKQFILIKTEEGFKLTDEKDSELLTGKVGQRFESDTADGHFAIFVRTLIAKPGTKFLLTHSSVQGLLVNMSKALSVTEQGKQSGVIKISFEGPSANYVTSVVNDIEDSYVGQNVERKSADAEQQLIFLRNQLPQRRSQVEDAQAKFKMYQTLHGSVDVTQETSNVLTQSVELETKRLELKEQRDEALQRFTAEHPTVKAIDEQLKSLDQEIEKINHKAEALPATQQEILNLTRELTINNQLYTDMTTTIQQLEITKAGTVGNVRIVDKALPPKLPIKPKRSSIIVGAAFMGTLLGIIIVFAQRAMLRGIDDPVELETRFGLSVYAMIPYSDEQKRLSTAMSKPGASGSFILTSLDSKNLAVEALRSFRTSLHFAMLEAPNKIVLFTGPSPGLGKSFVAVNLAAILALTGRRVVLVDADLRRGYLHKYFGINVEPGISDYVAREAEIGQVLHNTSIEGLCVVPRGTHPPNPSELLLHERFKDLLLKLDQAFDYVIVDSPPILAVTDAAIIGRLAGCTMLILKAAQHPVAEIDETLRRLSASGVVVRGAVFNQMGAKAGSYGYGNYGYTQYKYEG